MACSTDPAGKTAKREGAGGLQPPSDIKLPAAGGQQDTEEQQEPDGNMPFATIVRPGTDDIKRFKAKPVGLHANLPAR